jgi:hypothetical protein
MREKRYTAAHWHARAAQARADAAVLRPGSKMRTTLATLAGEYERLAEAAADQELAERRIAAKRASSDV